MFVLIMLFTCRYLLAVSLHLPKDRPLLERLRTPDFLACINRDLVRILSSSLGVLKWNMGFRC